MKRTNIIAPQIMKPYECILLIDDDPIINAVNKAILTELKVAKKIEMAINGADAINFLTSYSETHSGTIPDVILVDIKMPVSDGFDFLESYATLDFKNKNDTKVIILSTSEHAQDLEKSFKYHLSGYIVKPLTARKILPLINN